MHLQAALLLAFKLRLAASSHFHSTPENLELQF